MQAYTALYHRNFEDPLYLIGTNGIVSYKINQTPYETFVTGSDVTNLSNHVTGNYYTATNNSPSFLNRLEGNFSANENGIESLIYLPDFTNNGIIVLDKSVVDHIYFGTTNPSTSQVTGMPTWFKIDAANENTYNVSGITY